MGGAGGQWDRVVVGWDVGMGEVIGCCPYADKGGESLLKLLVEGV